MRRSTRVIGAIATIAFFSACGSDQIVATGSKGALPDVPVSGEKLASTLWQQTARNLVAQASLSPLAAGRAYPLLSVAQYLAVQRVGASLRDAGTGISGSRQQPEMTRGAVAGASAVVLGYLFPDKVGPLEEMVRQQAYETTSQSPSTLRVFKAGETIGRTVGGEIVMRAAGDHFNDANVAVAPIGDGKWTTSAIPAQRVAGGTEPGVTRWFLTSANQFRPPPPPAFGSTDFTAAVAEIRQISDARTTGQAQIAARWALNVGTPTATGFWLDFASQEIVKRGMSESEATHLFALLSAAMDDALIACWDAKLTYWLIRPWRADAGITTLATVGQPNHPSYPSGHSCASSAGAEVLSTIFPDKRVELDAMVKEAGMSRMYAGIHYRFDIEAGETLGRNVARFAITADGSGNSALTPR